MYSHRFQRRLRSALETMNTGDLKLFGFARLVFAILLRETVRDKDLAAAGGNGRRVDPATRYTNDTDVYAGRGAQ